MNVGSEESVRLNDRPIHVAFRREVNDRLGAMFIQQSAYQARVTDISANEKVARIVVNRVQV
jgi:hypothetical protein